MAGSAPNAKMFLKHISASSPPLMKSSFPPGKIPPWFVVSSPHYHTTVIESGRYADGTGLQTFVHVLLTGFGKTIMCTPCTFFELTTKILYRKFNSGEGHSRTFTGRLEIKLQYFTLLRVSSRI